MKNKWILFLISFVVFINVASSQQLPMYSQFNAVHSMLNPASIRTDFHLNQGAYETFIGVGSRIQWSGLANENNSQTIYYEKIIPNEGVALFYGGQLSNDKNGRIGNTGLHGRIGGVINDDLDWGGLAFGLNVGVMQYRVNMKDINARDENDLLAQDINSLLHPDIGVGAYFFKMVGASEDDIFHVGFSIPQLFQLDQTTRTELIYLSKTPHFYSNVGYIFTGNDDYSFFELSSQLFFAKNTPFHYSATAKYQFEDTFWLGGGYDSAAVLHFEGGLLFGYDRLFKLGASVDIPFNTYGPVFGNAFEIQLMVGLGQ